MDKCIKSYVLTDKQKEDSSRIVKELRKKYAKYDFITCETVIDIGIFYEPTKEDLDLLIDEDY